MPRGRRIRGIRALSGDLNATREPLAKQPADGPSASAAVSTCCCIIGAGPAGMMLALLLARAGIEVLVLEKHGDFLRDFRGDMIHPATMEVMDQIGLLDRLLMLPHQRLPAFVGQMGHEQLPMADFASLQSRWPFLVHMPQWDFLEFIRQNAAGSPGFALRTRCEVVGLVEMGERVAGVRVNGPDGPFTVLADLIVCADGRRSHTRERAGLAVQDIGTPIDALYMKISRRPGDGESLRRLAAGQILVNLDRTDYWQCALVIPKGTFAAIRQRGLDAFRDNIAGLVPAFRDRLADELATWDDVKLLDVTINRLARWHRAGLICIGDAAHAMSPVTGVGVNLAIQDAVAAANILAEPLRHRTLTPGHLRQVQQRRQLPTRLMQAFQTLVERQIMLPVLNGREPLTVPWPLRLLQRSRFLRRLNARIIGYGFRRERVRTTEISRTASAAGSPRAPR
jgi:2-polyprenyl-6-methoxyphenol hydroxylase-like FAD-dependent oxidoreductase